MKHIFLFLLFAAQLFSFYIEDSYLLNGGEKIEEYKKGTLYKKAYLLYTHPNEKTKTYKDPETSVLKTFKIKETNYIELLSILNESVFKNKNKLSALFYTYIVNTYYTNNEKNARYYKVLKFLNKGQDICISKQLYADIYLYGYYKKVNLHKAKNIYLSINKKNCSSLQWNIILSRLEVIRLKENDAK